MQMIAIAKPTVEKEPCSWYNKSDDNFKSWPSGNMTIASMMFSLPMLTDAMKKRSGRKNAMAFALACVFVLIYGYNRIHMTSHFLTDVCFGTLITYLIYALISTAFLRGGHLCGGSQAAE